jgi:hypothetical protein
MLLTGLVRGMGLSFFFIFLINDGDMDILNTNYTTTGIHAGSLWKLGQVIFHFFEHLQE